MVMCVRSYGIVRDYILVEERKQDTDFRRGNFSTGLSKKDIKIAKKRIKELHR